MYIYIYIYVYIYIYIHVYTYIYIYIYMILFSLWLTTVSNIWSLVCDCPSTTDLRHARSTNVTCGWSNSSMRVRSPALMAVIKFSILAIFWSRSMSSTAFCTTKVSQRCLARGTQNLLQKCLRVSAHTGGSSAIRPVHRPGKRCVRRGLRPSIPL